MALNKVEICGVDTSTLPVLTNERMRELFPLVHGGDLTAREEFIRGNLRLVLSVIQRFDKRGESPDDLFQVGVIGLIKAIDNFECDRGVKLSTYCVPMVIGEIRRHLRDTGAVRVSRSLRDTAYHAMQIKEALTNESGKEPTVEEIAEKMNIPKENVVMALESVVAPVSLYEPVFTDGNDTVYVMDQVGDKYDDVSWLEEISLKEAIAKLSEREKRILSLRYFRGKTQMEVAEVVGISQAQVSRIEKCALDSIKKGL